VCASERASQRPTKGNLQSQRLRWLWRWKEKLSSQPWPLAPTYSCCIRASQGSEPTEDARGRGDGEFVKLSFAPMAGVGGAPLLRILRRGFVD
jgi:hypothetical protein